MGRWAIERTDHYDALKPPPPPGDAHNTADRELLRNGSRLSRPMVEAERMVRFSDGSDMADLPTADPGSRRSSKGNLLPHSLSHMDGHSNLSYSRSPDPSGQRSLRQHSMGLAHPASSHSSMGLVPRHLQHLYGQELPSYMVGQCRYWHCPIHSYASSSGRSRSSRLASTEEAR